MITSTRYVSRWKRRDGSNKRIEITSFHAKNYQGRESVTARDLDTGRIGVITYDVLRESYKTDPKRWSKQSEQGEEMSDDRFDFQLKYYDFSWWVKLSDIQRDPDAIVASLVPDHKPRADSALVEKIRSAMSYGYNIFVERDRTIADVEQRLYEVMGRLQQIIDEHKAMETVTGR